MKIETKIVQVPLLRHNPQHKVLWGPSWGALGRSWGALGRSWGALEASWDPLGTLLGRSGGSSERPERSLLDFGPSQSGFWALWTSIFWCPQAAPRSAWGSILQAPCDRLASDSRAIRRFDELTASVDTAASPPKSTQVTGRLASDSRATGERLVSTTS